MFGAKRLKETTEYYERLIQEIKDANAAKEECFRNQISNLEKMVFSPTSSTVITDTAREADAIITVSEKPLTLSNDESDEETLREFDKVVSGEHEEYYF